MSYEWDLDDATGPTTDAVFNTTGGRIVEPRVTDDNGTMNTTTVTLNTESGPIPLLILSAVN